MRNWENQQKKPLSFKKAKGEIESFHTNTLLALKWCDKCEVTMLTSMHRPQLQDSDMVDRVTGEKKKKPGCVLECTKKMGLIDRVDMQLSFSESIRKTLMWNKKFFFHLFDMVLLNVFTLCPENWHPGEACCVQKESCDPNIGTVQDPDPTTKARKTNHRQPAATDGVPLPREGA